MIHTIRLYIEKYRLLSEDRPVLVGLSGGADSGFVGRIGAFGISVYSASL